MQEILLVLKIRNLFRMRKINMKLLLLKMLLLKLEHFLHLDLERLVAKLLEVIWLNWEILILWFLGKKNVLFMDFVILEILLMLLKFCRFFAIYIFFVFIYICVFMCVCDKYIYIYLYIYLYYKNKKIGRCNAFC